MKKHIRFYLPEAIAVLLLLMFTTSKVLAQSMTPLAPLAANSTVGFDSLMKVYKSNLFIDLGNDTPRVNKQLARIANVWDYRTSNTIPAGYDRFSAAGKAFKTAANDRNSLCENRHPDFNGSWEFLGPKNLPVQEYGVNWDVWIDPMTP